MTATTVWQVFGAAWGLVAAGLVAGALGWPSVRRQAVAVGIVLYGALALVLMGGAW